MKRKLALLLAGVMTLTMLPMNLFAASNNTLTRTAQVVPKGTVFFDEGIPGLTTGALTALGDTKHKVVGSHLKIELKNGVTKGETITLQLTNGKWFFRNYNNGVINPGLAQSVVANQVNAATSIHSAASLYNEVPGEFDVLSTKGIFDENSASTPFNGTGEQATYNTGYGTWVTKSSTSTGGYYVRNNGSAAAGLTKFTSPVISGGTIQEVPYVLKVSEVDDKVAYLTVLDNAATSGGDYIMVPLVVMATVDDAEITVALQNAAGTSITQESKVVGIGGAGATNTVMKDIAVGRKTINLDPIIVNEVRISSIGTNGQFEIQAPNGYEFTDPQETRMVNGVATRISSIKVDPGLSATNSTFVWDWKARGIRDEENRSVIVVTVPPSNMAGSSPLVKSTSVPGRIYISGLSLEAEDDAPWGDVMFNIKNVVTTAYGDLKITDQSFKAAEHLDWTVSLTAKDTTVKELVNGRYVTYSDSNFDTYHKASTVIFKEQSLHSWWADRETKFVLPEGVRFRQVKITDVVNMDDNSNVARPVEDKVYRVGDFDRYVKLNQDSLVFRDMKIDKDEKAKIEFEPWLSIRADYTGDIPLTVTGSGVPQEVPAAIIAKAIAPVKVITKSTDIKIGYQYQTVSDIEITENLAGALVKNKQVRLSVTDLVSTDVQFSPNIAVNVTDGDLKLKDKNTASFNGFAGSKAQSGYASGASLGTTGGVITFAIDRSSTKASTIKLSNVSVKIDRTIPESNDRPYKLVVWGTAIAENYGDKDITTEAWYNVPGVQADYVSVISAANDKTNVLTTEVRVTIGESTYSVNGEVFDMPAAAYISPKSNSTMVPLRFVANAFGIKDTQIVWDEVLRTVTLTDPSGKLIQFTVGKSEMVINGVKVPLLSPDGKQVSAEITDERTYVPFRAIGTAFGIDVAWDADTNTAIYNPGAAKANNGAVQTAETAKTE